VIFRALAFIVRRVRLWQAHRGAYGDEVLWSLELIEEDEKTRAYVTPLDNDDLHEIRVIAESKEDVRALIEDRAQRYL